jgi:hypothetical protein
VPPTEPTAERAGELGRPSPTRGRLARHSMRAAPRPAERTAAIDRHRLLESGAFGDGHFTSYMAHPFMGRVGASSTAGAPEAARMPRMVPQGAYQKWNWCFRNPVGEGYGERKAAVATGRETRLILSGGGSTNTLAQAGHKTIWQQFDNNIGCVSPTCLLCHWEKSGGVTAFRTSNLTVSPTFFQRHADGRRAGLKIRSSQEGLG